MQNTRFLDALLKKPVDRTPIWVMRQAGRYLPEYRAIREEVKDFLALCQNPDLACEITMQPLRRFNLDAAIIFSDILTVPNAMGLDLRFAKGEGPVFSDPVQNEKAVDALRIPDPESELQYVMNAIRKTRKALNGQVPLIGFSGSPWTVATYMVEGRGTKQFNVIKKMLYANPECLRVLLEKVTQATILYLKAQIEAGAQAIMVFDTWGGVLSPEAYQAFSLTYMQKIIEALPRAHNGATIPTVIFTKNGGLWLEKIAAAGSDGVGVDWTIDIANARDRIGDKVTIQGNLDPNILYATDDVIVQHATDILTKMRDHHHVFNLGHGIYPDVNPDKLGVLVDTVNSFK